MTTPLLKTKLYIPPPRPNLVPRPRLIQQLDEGLRLGRQLTLVSAQAGFGKTTLLSDWAQALQARHSPPVPVAWLSLDEGDNDPLRFWAYVVAALQTVQTGVGQSVLAFLQSPQPAPTDAILVTLINELAEVPGPFCLVLDDYHVIGSPATQASHPIHGALAFLVDHQPPQMHLAIATRADPPLPIPRLRGRGQVTELRVTDLRFLPDEAAAFLNRNAGIDLTTEDVAALERRTEGWVTGLQLAALALQPASAGQEIPSSQGRQDVAGFVEAFTGSSRYVLDYLAEEVLQRQAEDVQSFLLETSVLSRLTGSLCDVLTNRQDSKAMLSELEQQNLFLVPLDDERQWYRYHRLFADLLRARLEDALPERVPELHRRASVWYEEQDALDDAVRHALAAGDLARVARMIEAHGMPILMQGELTTLRRWIEALPEEMIQASARICVVHAWVHLLTGQADSVEPRLQRAEHLLEMTAAIGRLPADIATIRAYMTAYRGDVRLTIEQAQRALDLLGDDDQGARAIVYFVLGGAYLMRGDVALAIDSMTQASVSGQRGGNLHIAVPALNSLAGLQLLRGRLRQAQATAQKAIELVTGPSGRPLAIAAGAISALADLACEWNDLDSALAYAQQSLELGRQWGNADTLGDGYLTLSRVLQAQGDLEGACRALQEADRMGQELMQTPLFSTQLRAAWARLWLAQRNLEALAGWAEGAAPAQPDPLHGEEILALMQARLALGQPEAALRMAGPLLEMARAHDLVTMVIETLALQALAHQDMGDTAGALDRLVEALVLADREGHVRRIVDRGEGMASLLHVARARGIAVLQASRLLAAFGEAELGREPAADLRLHLAGAQPLVDPLSDRELEVLRLIAAGHSNREIAEDLVVAVSTVKSHANHIFGKLDVGSRTQAVAKAQELGLLE